MQTRLLLQLTQKVKLWPPERPKGDEGSLSLQSPARSDLVEVTNRQSLPTFNRERSAVNFSLGPVACIDADVLRSEVAGPVAGHGFARVQIHDQRNVFGKKF